MSDNNIRADLIVELQSQSSGADAIGGTSGIGDRFVPLATSKTSGDDERPRFREEIVKFFSILG